MKDLSKTDFEILWTGQPAGLWQRFLSLIKMNFTTYKITKDELIVTTGFFSRKTNTIELYTLKEAYIKLKEKYSLINEEWES